MQAEKDNLIYKLRGREQIDENGRVKLLNRKIKIFLLMKVLQFVSICQVTWKLVKSGLKCTSVIFLSLVFCQKQTLTMYQSSLLNSLPTSVSF